MTDNERNVKSQDNYLTGPFKIFAGSAKIISIISRILVTTNFVRLIKHFVVRIITKFYGWTNKKFIVSTKYFSESTELYCFFFIPKCITT